MAVSKNSSETEMQAHVPSRSDVVRSQPLPGINPAIPVWMPRPIDVPDCPPGLEHLASVDQLLFKQKAFSRLETNYKYKYTIKNALDQNVYLAVEENDSSNRNCCGSARSFSMMKVLDNYGNEVIPMVRPHNRCLFSTEVFLPSGEIIGSIEQIWTFCTYRFVVKNQFGEQVFHIDRPKCVFSCCADMDYEILGLDGIQIGKISRPWSGFSSTDANNFGVYFPLDLNVKMKAVLLGACFLIIIVNRIHRMSIITGAATGAIVAAV